MGKRKAHMFDAFRATAGEAASRGPRARPVPRTGPGFGDRRPDHPEPGGPFDAERPASPHQRPHPGSLAAGPPAGHAVGSGPGFGWSEEPSPEASGAPGLVDVPPAPHGWAPSAPAAASRGGGPRTGSAEAVHRPRADRHLEGLPAASVDPSGGAAEREWSETDAALGELEDDAPGETVLPVRKGTFVLLQLGLVGVAFALGARFGGPVTDWGGALFAAAPDGGAAAPGAGPEAPEGDGQVAGQSPARNLTPRAPRGGAGTTPAGPNGAAGPAAPRDPAEAAFLDPRNLFTVQVASYDDSPRGRELAEHWRADLADRGYPAVVRQVKRKLSLFVGASPNLVAMEELQEQLGRLTDRNGARLFPDVIAKELADFR
jgi:hypothetical protein